MTLLKVGGYEWETSCLPRDACETIVKTAERFCLELRDAASYGDPLSA